MVPFACLSLKNTGWKTLDFSMQVLVLQVNPVKYVLNRINDYNSENKEDMKKIFWLLKCPETKCLQL